MRGDDRARPHRRRPATGRPAWPPWPTGSARSARPAGSSSTSTGARREGRAGRPGRRAWPCAWPTGGPPASRCSTCSGSWPFRSRRAARSTGGCSSPDRRPSRWSRWPWASWPVAASAGRAAGRDGPLVCVDLGTGSGAIALSLAVEGPPASGRRPRGLGHRPLAGGPRGGPGQPSTGLPTEPAAAGRPGRSWSRGPWFDGAARPAGRAGRPGRVQPAVRVRGRVRRPRPGRPVSGSPRRALWSPARRPDGVAGMADIEARRGRCRRGGCGRAAGWWSRSPRTRPTAAIDVGPAGRVRPGRDEPGPGRPAPHAGGRALTAASRGGLPRPGAVERGGRRPWRDGAVVAVPPTPSTGWPSTRPSPTAVARLFALKGRPADGARCRCWWSGPEQVALGGRPARVGRPARWPTGYWPGPLTLVVPRRRTFTVDLGGRLGRGRTVGRPLARPPGGGRPVRAARPAGRDQCQPPRCRRRPRRPTQVVRGLRRQRAARRGARRRHAATGSPSTVVECRGPASRCLREGALAWADLHGRPGPEPPRPQLPPTRARGVDGARPDAGHLGDAARRVAPARRRNHYRLGTHRSRCVPPDRPPGGRFFNFRPASDGIRGRHGQADSGCEPDGTVRPLRSTNEISTTATRARTADGEQLQGWRDRRRRHRPRGGGRGPQGGARRRRVASTPPTTTSGPTATSAPARSCPTRSSRSCGARTPSSSGPSAPRSAPPRSPRAPWSGACCSACASSSTSTSTCGPSPGSPARRPRTATSWSIRENTEGTYAGEGGFLRKGTPFEVATQGSVNTRHGVERCVRFAFDLAATRPRRHLTLVHKTNVLTFAGDLWQRTVDEVAADYPDVTRDYNHVDAACIYLVENPGRYDVIVTDNLFGDIITDLAGAVAGGIGYAASANLNPDRTGPSLFEPVHGAAHDIAGTGRANPAAAIRSAALMLDHLGETDGRRAGHQGGHRTSSPPTPDPSLSTAADRRRHRRKALSHAHHPDREDLDGRRARRLGRRHRARAHPHHALRLRRVRGHPRLPDRPRAWPSSACATTSSGCSCRPRSS